MVEEAGMYFKSLDVTNADGIAGGREMEGDDLRVLEWMDGLPSSEDLIPLTQLLVSPDLASAFRIPRPDLQTILDLHQATQNTISNLLGHQNQRPSLPPENSLKHFSSAYAQNTAICDPNDPQEYNTSQIFARFSSDQADGSSTATETAVLEEEDSPSIRADSSVDENPGRMLKRPRIVWTPQLHKRFVDAVAHLGIKNAVPKTIMQLMNVDGLTRENVASHLQKYRLYLKRSHVFSDEGTPSSSDHLFASTSLLPRLHEQQMPVPLPPYALSTMIPMPIYNMPHRHSVGLVPVSNHQGKPLV